MKFKKKHEHKEQSNKIITEWEKLVYPFPIIKVNPIYSKITKEARTKEELKKELEKWKNLNLKK